MEMALVGVFVAVALVAISSRRVVASDATPMAFAPPEETSDLPCPWCESQTREADNHCPNCGQRFG